ncbi:MAG: hypothetical protein IPL61_08335 [Myxococcales bacterium]|nr:hypothetical protein [Myxococcales bacterium]
MRGPILAVLAVASACAAYDPDPAPDVVRARFDPDAKVIPMPSDALRDDLAGHLDIPIDDDTSAAEAELYGYLNTLDGWSSASAATVDFSAPIAPATVTPDTVQVWQWGPTPHRVDDVTVTVADDELRVTLDAPRVGWDRGGQYYVVVRGGAAGVEGKGGQPVIADAAFYFLRQTTPLDDPAHNRAFPGDTFAERADNARKLEEIRQELLPMFDHLAERGLPRAEIAALWRFTITTRTELAMDKPSQRMPIPIQLLIDPATGKVDLPPARWDTPVELEAKAALRVYDGFATSANLLFELTAPVDPATVTGTTVELWQLGAAPTRLPATARVLDDVHVVITPATVPLAEHAAFAVVVTDGVRDRDGQPIIAMPAGALLLAKAPVVDAGASTVGAVPLVDAVRIEDARDRLAALLALRGRDRVVAAWPFVTQTIAPRLDEVAATAARLAVSPDPVAVAYKTPGQALLDFPLAITSLLNVDRVATGTLPMPVFLDDATRAWRTDGGHRIDQVAFTMTIPRGLTPGQGVPVVVFGHGVMTERRFVLAIGDALAAKGFAAIAIDLPYHGTRTQCIAGGPISVVDPRTGNLVSLPPCQAGSTCDEVGRCVDASGAGNHLAQWPVLNYPVASGAAFLEIEHIANTKDHFDQAVIELSAVVRSLATGAWQPVLGAPVDTTRIYYAGQSLGGILGATLLATQPTIRRAVLNVPGADLVDMFADSTWFGPQVRGFFTREGIAADSFEAERFLDVARWIVDAVDPQNVGAATGDRALMLQMATLDFIIPNAYTRTLARVTGAPQRDYVAEHAFLVIPIEPEFGRGGRELAGFLDESFRP